jgi:hypothetical protein
MLLALNDASICQDELALDDASLLRDAEGPCLIQELDALKRYGVAPSCWPAQAWPVICGSGE